MGPKTKKFRSKKYTDWVKSLPSCISGEQAHDPHHIKGHGQGGTVRASDLFTMPLTRWEHTYFHDTGPESWEAEFKTSQWIHVINTIEQALDEGVIELSFVIEEINNQVVSPADLELLGRYFYE